VSESGATRASALNCDCGYLGTGVLPNRLCFDCGDRALAAWVAEEKNLLGRAPGYATDVAEIVRDAAQRQEKALRARANEPFADAAWERSKAARRLSKVRRARKSELDSASLDRWRTAADVVGRDPRDLFRKESRRFSKRGAGAAALTALGADAMEILLKTTRARGR